MVELPEEIVRDMLETLRIKLERAREELVPEMRADLAAFRARLDAHEAVYRARLQAGFECKMRKAEEDIERKVLAAEEEIERKMRAADEELERKLLAAEDEIARLRQLERLRHSVEAERDEGSLLQ